LKLEYDEPLSNLAVNFSLRRYTMAFRQLPLQDVQQKFDTCAVVGRCRFNR
jgi:hypothetical protein